jgi:hypothetical protein
MTSQSSKALPRYAVKDAYVLEELRGLLIHGTREERLRTLADAYAGGPLPYDLAVIALNDQEPLVRRWMAANAKDLDFRERVYPNVDRSD